MHISELVPDPGERHGLFGGTRAGKSAFQDFCMREVQETRPDAMQVLIDTKPRFRAETEKSLRPRWRRNAAHRYESWAKGPVVPNSVVVDIWDSKPFAGTFERPGEIVILQSGDAADWRRMLTLLDGFVKANIKGRERRIIVDECLDFTSKTHTGLIPKTMFCYALLERAAKGISGLISVPIKFRACPGSCERCFPASLSFICETMMPI